MLEAFAQFTSITFLAYFLVYNTSNMTLLAMAFFDVRKRLWMNGLDDRALVVNSPYTPPLSILVPAYNEAVTICDSLKSLVALNLPRFEILIVNDGSSDNMMDVLKKELKLRRRDIPYREAIRTATVVGLYEATCDLPDAVTRMIVVDKANGGKADALNAGINASECPYVISMDADSVIDDDALLQIFRVMLERPDVAAVGGQIAVANGCKLRNGKVIDVGLPKSHLARIQIVEYLRSFTTARTGLSRLNALLIVSGVFCIFRKDLLIKVGGYLTEHVRSKLVHEYAGMGSSTVCEDMEVVVRLHRYIYEKGLDLSILSMPYPICWTEVPERAEDLAKQRGRWSRGFMEIMVYHREMIFNPRYGIIGMFGWPFLCVFDFLGLFVEAFGYVSLPVLAAMGVLSYKYLLMIISISFGYGVLVSMLSILVAYWSEPNGLHDTRGQPLLRAMSVREIALLLLYAVIENFGYRQLSIWWRLKGVIDYLRGNKSWDKFERIGMASEPEEETAT
jgi:cellulose synthase/poly-beta-1,6-N-acetylglucosamine synthase-like glycosyltransferase